MGIEVHLRWQSFQTKCLHRVVRASWIIHVWRRLTLAHIIRLSCCPAAAVPGYQLMRVLFPFSAKSIMRDRCAGSGHAHVLLLHVWFCLRVPLYLSKHVFFKPKFQFFDFSHSACDTSRQVHCVIDTFISTESTQLVFVKSRQWNLVFSAYLFIYVQHLIICSTSKVCVVRDRKGIKPKETCYTEKISGPVHCHFVIHTVSPSTVGFAPISLFIIIYLNCHLTRRSIWWKTNSTQQKITEKERKKTVKLELYGMVCRNMQSDSIIIIFWQRCAVRNCGIRLPSQTNIIPGIDCSVKH